MWNEKLTAGTFLDSIRDAKSFAEGTCSNLPIRRGSSIVSSALQIHSTTRLVSALLSDKGVVGF